MRRRRSASLRGVINLDHHNFVDTNTLYNTTVFLKNGLLDHDILTSDIDANADGLLKFSDVTTTADSTVALPGNCASSMLVD